jgi:hypothetical protein
MWSNRLYNVTPNGLFALHSAVSIVWVGGAIGVARNARLSEWRTVATAAAVGFVGAISIPSLDSGSRVAVWLRVSRTVTIYLPLLVVLIGSISRRRSLRDTLELSLTASAILMLAMQSWMVAGQVSAEYRGWRVTSINDVSPEHQVVSWIRAETPPEAVLATNHLCDVPACPEPATSAGAGFAVATGRRFLVAAPLYALAYSAESDTWRGRDRVGASIEFGRAPTSELAATLREAGVGWFVAERARSGAVDWGAVGDVRFENVDYLVIELRDS